MDKNTTQVILLGLLLFACIPSVANTREAKQVVEHEKVVLFTDRSIYIVGERVCFSAVLFNMDSLSGLSASQILYCELIAPDGVKSAGGKFKVYSSCASGSLAIPTDLLTGTYYIRAYTKLMRNFGPVSFGYSQIRIVNPIRPELASIAESLKTVSFNETNDTLEKDCPALTVVADRASYFACDTVNVSVGALAGFGLRCRNICVSVVPEATKSTSAIRAEAVGEKYQKNMYYAENQGLSLIGKLNYGPTEIPIKGKKVNLSVMGEGRDFMAVRTDSSGRFFFALPSYYGTRDLFICAERLPLKDVKIWVDNDFCTTAFSLPAPKFLLSVKERNAVYNMAQNVQIQSQYAFNFKPEGMAGQREEKAFYGKPTSVIYLDQYIQLPTLEDYFNELPSQVKVRKHKGEPYFNVIGSRDVSFYDPLVLIDWVAVDEPSKIMAISPTNVSRIEIVNETYIKGDQKYGGIISIISKKGDFAGIDLPSTGIFINYSFLTESHFTESNIWPKPNYPDTRNTLFWQPNVSVKDGENTSFRFSAPDTPGKYEVFLEGVTADGEIVSKTCLFEINR